MVTNWRSDSTCTLLFSSCWWTYCWLSNNQTDLQLNQIFSERSEPLVDVSTQFIKAQTLMCFMLSDCCSDCAWLYTNGEICIPVIDAVHSFSLGYLDFIFTFRSSLVTLWTRVLWSGLLSLNLHPTLPESSWSRPEGARVWARMWASASSSTILCCWSWPNRTWCLTTPCETANLKCTNTKTSTSHSAANPTFFFKEYLGYNLTTIRPYP